MLHLLFHDWPLSNSAGHKAKSRSNLKAMNVGVRRVQGGGGGGGRQIAEDGGMGVIRMHCVHVGSY